MKLIQQARNPRLPRSVFRIKKSKRKMSCVRYLVLTKGKCAIVSNLLYFDRANDKNRNNFVRPFFEYKLEKSSNIYSWLIQMKVPSN